MQTYCLNGDLGLRTGRLYQLFANSLTHDLSSALEQDNCKNMTTRRERMWGRYRDIRTSEHFRSTWCNFIQAQIGCSNNPILYQYITDQIFSETITQVTSTTFIKSCHNNHHGHVVYTIYDLTFTSNRKYLVTTHSL